MSFCISNEVVRGALRRAAPRVAAQHCINSGSFTTLVPPLLRGGVVVARQPLPQNQ